MVVRNSFKEIKLANGEVTISKKWRTCYNFVSATLQINVGEISTKVMERDFADLRQEKSPAGAYNINFYLARVSMVSLRKG